MNDADYTMEEKLKQQQYSESIAQSQPQQCGEPMRETLTRRIDSRLYRAEKESRNNERLRELRYLLNKHPEIARILDLLDADLLQGL